MKLSVARFSFLMVLAGCIGTPLSVFSQVKTAPAPGTPVELNIIESLTFVPVQETDVNPVLLFTNNPDLIMEFSTQRMRKPAPVLLMAREIPPRTKRKTFFSRHKYWIAGGTALLVSASVLTFRKNGSSGSAISPPPGRPF